ncbi:hypothetical protein FDZ71_09850, partial [bacterium]
MYSLNRISSTSRVICKKHDGFVNKGFLDWYISSNREEAATMLNTIIIALWLTMLLGFLVESMKTKAAYVHVRQMNRQLESRLMNLMSGISDVSVFSVRDLRNILMEEFVKPHLIDDLELY